MKINPEETSNLEQLLSEDVLLTVAEAGGVYSAMLAGDSYEHEIVADSLRELFVDTGRAINDPEVRSKVLKKA